MSKSKRPKVRRGDRAHTICDNRDDVVVHLVEMEVTFDPIPDRDIEALPEEWKARLAPVFQGFGRHFKQFIPLLEEAIAYAPHIPLLWNFLNVAYMQAGRYDEAERLTLQTHERFPRYLTGTINYCQWLIAQGRAEEVPDALGGDFHLPRIAERSTFHVTEIVNFYILMSDYHCRLGEIELADRTLDCLKELVDGNPNVEAARRRITYWRIRNSLSFLGRRKSRPKQPRK